MIHKNLIVRRKRNKAKKSIYGISILQRYLPLYFARKQMELKWFPKKEEIDEIARRFKEADQDPHAFLLTSQEFPQIELITPDFDFKKEMEHIEQNLYKALGVPKEMLQDASAFSR